MNAQSGLADLRNLLRVVAAMCQEFAMPQSFIRASEVTDQQINTLQEALSGDVPYMHVDLFSMTVVFFGRSLARYYDACVSCEPSLDRLLRDNVPIQELTEFFSLSTPRWQREFQDDAARNDDNDGGYSGGDRRPDALTIITTFMERRHKRRDRISQSLGQIPFFIMKLARNLVYHGTETPREMALLASACIESSLLIREIHSQRQIRESSYKLYVEPTLKECRILLSWLTTAGGYGVDLAPVLRAAVCDAPIPVDEIDLYPDAFEKLRRIICDEAPLLRSHPRLFEPQHPDFVRLVPKFETFERIQYRNRELRNAICDVTGINIQENDDIDAILKTWLLENVILEDQRASCMQYSASDLLRRELARLPEPVLRRVAPIPYSVGFHHVSASERSSLQRMFRARFHDYRADLTCAQAVPNRRKFEFEYPIEILSPSVDGIRFDLISMMLIIGAGSDSLGLHLSGWTVPMDDDDIGRHGVGGFSSNPRPSVVRDAIDAEKPIHAARSYLMVNGHTSQRTAMKFSLFCTRDEIRDAFHGQNIRRILETRPDLFQFQGQGGQKLFLKVVGGDTMPRKGGKSSGDYADSFVEVTKPDIVKKVGSLPLTKVQELQKLKVEKPKELGPYKEDGLLLPAFPQDAFKGGYGESSRAPAPDAGPSGDSVTVDDCERRSLPVWTPPESWANVYWAHVIPRYNRASPTVVPANVAPVLAPAGVRAPENDLTISVSSLSEAERADEDIMRDFDALESLFRDARLRPTNRHTQLARDLLFHGYHAGNLETVLFSNREALKGRGLSDGHLADLEKFFRERNQ
jgi:hypothetical protein